jgi:hypothetical protein
MSLPETYRTGHHMARVLTRYIDDPFRVRREVMQMFLNAPNIDEVRAMRARHLREIAATPERICHSPSDGYWPDQASRQAENDNRRFVEALSAAGARA